VAAGEFIGVAKFSAAGAAQLREAYHQARRTVGDGPFGGAASFRKAYLIDLIQHLIEAGVAVQGVGLPGGYYEIDTTEDYGIAQREWPDWVASQSGRPLAASSGGLTEESP
jgi:hypothetical protein